MALNTLLRSIIAIFAIGITMIAFLPAINSLYYQQDIWESAPAEMLQMRDNFYTLLKASPMLVIGSVFIWAYVSTQRKDGGY